VREENADETQDEQNKEPRRFVTRDMAMAFLETAPAVARFETMNPDSERFLTLYVRTGNTVQEMKCPMGKHLFKMFSIYNYTSLFHSICLKDLYRHKSLCEV